MTKDEESRLYASISDRIREGDSLVFELFKLLVYKDVIFIMDALDIMEQAFRPADGPVLIHKKEENDD